MKRGILLTLGVGILLCGLARAQSVSAATPGAELPEPSADVAAVRSRYEYGEFAQVEATAQALLDRGDLSRTELRDVHLYAGLAAFNRGEKMLADRHFAALLRVEPDWTLDPFLAPPSALRAFEAVRNRLAPELVRLRADQQTQRDVEARAHAAAQRALVESQARQASARQFNGRSLWVNLLPFGAGQFQQGRVGAGIAFAVSEAVLAAVSLITYFIYSSLITTVNLPVNNQALGGTGQIPIQGIPRAQQGTAELLHALNLGTTIGAYAVYAGGVAEAFLRYHELELPPPAPVSVHAQGAGLQLAVTF